MTSVTTPIAFVTHSGLPELTESDRLVVAPLQTRGIEIRAEIWDRPSRPWAEYSLVVLRSTWDYWKRAEEFRSWLRQMEHAPLANPAERILWDLDKRYLRELEAVGVPIVPTRWLTPQSPEQAVAAVERGARDLGWEKVIIKPAVSANAQRTLRTQSKDHGAISELFSKPGGQPGETWMLQPYLEEIESAGELSLVFLGGEFSHAVSKVPARGDFRTQHDYGAAVRRVQPPAVAVELGERILEAELRLSAARARHSLNPASRKSTARTSPLLYARVDLVPDGGRWLLGELEIAEPDLYLNYDPEAPKRFAAAIVAHPGVI